MVGKLAVGTYEGQHGWLIKIDFNCGLAMFDPNGALPSIPDDSRTFWDSF